MMDRLPPFDLNDLRLLLALAQHKHFARAADACGLSQPAVSARIRRLETALEAPLVFRGKRFEGFTPEGERALSWARRILADCGGLAQDVSVGEVPSGFLRLGVVPSAAPVAGQLCAGLSLKFPKIRFRVVSLPSAAIEVGLSDYSIDAGLTYLERRQQADIESIPVYRERYVLVAHKEMQLPTKDDKTVAWDVAADLPLCLLTPDMHHRHILDEAFEQAGKRPEPKFESNSFNAILALVRQGGFAAIMPRIQVEQGRAEGLAVWQLTAPDILATVGLLFPKREPELPVVRALKSALPAFALHD